MNPQQASKVKLESVLFLGVHNCKKTMWLSTPVENSEATWKKATKCNKIPFPSQYLKKNPARPKIYVISYLLF